MLWMASALTPDWPFNTFETVAIENPVCFEISLIVAMTTP
jgi:hypothetical protein